ncbi:hypothetical protein Dda_1219 [Drechslerella dactyloides]|uniref:Uncharacterized protein n=1 Tax=Drechslerella dactyloides TaxID=74499 RepID=A0AAD6J5X3_DREDA|nr:hypothetical protein Dda_1219 [Drechslerella dactyloides]
MCCNLTDARLGNVTDRDFYLRNLMAENIRSSGGASEIRFGFDVDKERMAAAIARSRLLPSR